MHYLTTGISVIIIALNHMNCVTSAGLVDCNQTDFPAGYGNVPPYAYVSDGQIRGAIVHVAQYAVQKCCGDNVNVTYVSNFSTVRDVEENLSTEHIGLPAVKTGLTIVGSEIEGYYFLPVMETTGSILIFDRSKVEASPIGHALIQCWPMAVLVISSAGIAGILIWILDRYWNPSEFPKHFFNGAWEGTWWAYVTMTTVGYGDRSPKSIPARVFGLIWMFVGIILMSIFTATLTTALTSNEVQDFHLKGSKIGVLRGTLEQLYAYREGCIVTEYPTFTTMTEALKSETVEALLVDVNYALFLIDRIEEENLKLGEELDNKAVYGIIFQGQPNPVEQCFAKQISKSQFIVYDELNRHLGIYRKRTVNHAGETTGDLMTGLYTIIAVISVLWIVSLIGAILWECLYYRPKMTKDDSQGNFCTCCFKRKSTAVEAVTVTKTEATVAEEITKNQKSS